MQHFSIHLPDADATAAFGAALARVLAPGLVLHLRGDLGSGKTALTRAMLHAAGHVGPVRSPTYTLAEPYTIALDGKPVRAMHFDLYRMADPEEFIDAGFRDEFNGDTICVIEWPEKAAGLLPSPDIALSLAVDGEGRALELQAFSDKGRLCLDRLHHVPTR